MIERILPEVRQQFNAKYEAWKATSYDPWLALRSDPGAWAQSEKYDQLLQFCQEQGKKVWPLVSQRLTDGDTPYILENVVLDMTLDEYGHILERVRHESQHERYTKEGSYIVPSVDANLMKYAKELLVLL